MLRPLGIAVLAALIAAGTPPPGTPADVDVDRVTIGMRPVGAERTRFEPTLDPGETYDDAVEVVNLGAQALPVTVFASDAVLTASGAFGLQPAGDQPEDGGSWVAFGTQADSDSTSVTIPAGESVEVPFRVTVPADAAPGDHLAAIVARADDGADGAVVRQHRVGVRLLLHVTGRLRAVLHVEDPRAAYRATSPVGGVLTVSATLANTGNVALRAQPAVRVSALFDLWQTTVPLEKTDLIPPGAALSITGEVPDVPAFGPLTVTLTTVTEVDAGAPDPGAMPAPLSTTTVWAWSWTIGGLALVITALIVLLALSLGSSRRRFDRRLREALSDRLGSADGAAEP